MHQVDALAMIGDEGRVSLRKAWWSWQKSIDTAMSEWGNLASGNISDYRLSKVGL